MATFTDYLSAGNDLLKALNPMGAATSALKVAAPVVVAPLDEAAKAKLAAQGDQRYTNATAPVSGKILPAPFTPQPMLSQTENYPGQLLTEARLADFDINRLAQSANAAPTAASALSPAAAALTNFINPQQQGAGITFGPTGTAAISTPENQLAQQFTGLLNKVAAMANTAPSGSDSFVDFFQKAATRKRGQEALVGLANLAGQANTTQAQLAQQGALQQAQMSQQAQEAGQRNALLAGQTLLQSETSMAEKNAALEAAKARAALEAPKTAAETAKAQAEAQKGQTLNLLGQGILQAQAAGQAVPQSMYDTYSLLATGQKPTVAKFKTHVTLDAKGQPLVVTENTQTGQITQAGNPEDLAAVAQLPAGQSYQSKTTPGLYYFRDKTGKLLSGTAQEALAATKPAQ